MESWKDQLTLFSSVHLNESLDVLFRRKNDLQPGIITAPRLLSTDDGDLSHLGVRRISFVNNPWTRFDNSQDP